MGSPLYYGQMDRRWRGLMYNLGSSHLSGAHQAELGVLEPSSETHWEGLEE
jgi:hypothetical protein